MENNINFLSNQKDQSLINIDTNLDAVTFAPGKVVFFLSLGAFNVACLFSMQPQTLFLLHPNWYRC
jgi:uncharacterized membrane protein